MAGGGDPDTAEAQGNEDDLTEEQHERLVQYQEVTGTEDLEAAKRRLILHNWNLESAVQDVFNESEGLPSVYTQQTISSPHQQQHFSEIVQPPHQQGFHRHQHLVGSGVNSLANPARMASAGNPIEDVVNFKTNFELEFGTAHPTFYQGTYSQVLADAKKELKFLLVYLHSDSHQDTSKFCIDVLCNPGFKEYINGNMLFWACSVNSYEGNRVSRALRETTYPFLAVICLRENRMTIVWKVEGYMQVDPLIAILSNVIDENEPALVAARAEREELSASQAIRNEQDIEFQRSQELDREKARKKKALEDAKREEEERKLQKEREKERKLEDIASRKECCRQRMLDIPEPACGQPGVIQIKIKLPDGSIHSRSFSKSDEFQLLVDFVFSQEKTPNQFNLNSNFPRKSYPVDAANNLSIEDVGIGSSTMLFVQDVTEESSDEE
eukprot:gene16927-18634_t